MTILQTGVTLPLNLKAGETLVIKELSGTSTVTGSTASREDASTSIGAGFVVYGPQPSDCSVTLTTTGAADWFVGVGDASPPSTNVLYQSGQLVTPGGQLVARTQTKYLGQCTDGIRMPTAVNNSLTQMLMRKRLKLGSGGASYVQARFPNFAVVSNNNGLETGTGGSATIKAYLVIGGTISAGAITGGRIVQCTWGGATSVSVADKAISPLHDPIYVNAPAGSVIWYQISYENAAGIVFETGLANAECSDSTNGENFRFAASGMDMNQISSMAAWTGGTTSPNHGYGPFCVVTPRTGPSVMYVGTSIDMGFRSSSNNGGNKGALGRVLAAAGIPYICVAQGGSKMSEWNVLANRALRMEAEQYCSHIITGHMINDLLEGAAVDATVLAQRFSAHRATFSENKPVFAVTSTPRTTGTATNADGSDQTPYDVSGFNARRLAGNALVRGGLPGYAGYFDYSSAFGLPGAVENKWFANGTTDYMFGAYTPADYLHPGTVGEQYAATSGVLDVSCILR